MFNIVKEQINLIEYLEKELGVTFKQSGEKNWAIEGDKDVESCPFCGHHDCFRLYHAGVNSEAYYKCFSCDEKGDVVTWKSKKDKIGMGDAARALAKEYGLQLPNTYNPVQEVFNLSAVYYHNCLMDTCNKPYPLLGGKTPLKYQLEIRRRKEPTLVQQKVGFSDGNLVDYLESLGTDPEVMENSGVVKRDRNGILRDFLPRNCFIYPHFIKGKVSHFTFKDPLKKLQFQLPKKFSLNGYMFYGQDSFDTDDLLVLVEGENDRLAVLETGKVSNVMAIIGQISHGQLEWLKANCSKKKILTIFDPDDAGDKYRRKVEGLRGYFRGLAHILPPGEKDIDELLVSGGDLQSLIQNNLVKIVLEDAKDGIEVPWETPDEVQAPTPSPEAESAVNVVIEAPGTSLQEVAETEPLAVPLAAFPASSGEPAAGLKDYFPPSIPGSFASPSQIANTGQREVVTELEDCPVVQQRGTYARVKYNVDKGEYEYTRISDFTIELLNVFLKEDGDREREVVIHRPGHAKSDPFLVSSEIKVSLKAFKVLVAKMADAEWLGRDSDLDAMWRLVYKNSPQAIIKIPRQVGWHSKHKCWIFKNVLITGSGVAVTPDENGVFWVNGRTLGIKPMSLNVDEGAMDSSIPMLEMGKTREETDLLLAQAIHELGRNLNSTGAALLSLGWIWSNVYSDVIFKENTGMSLLFFWSSNGGGKTTIASWLRSFFGFSENTGRTTIQRLHSGIGFQRQGEYYSSLPMFLDEVRRCDKSIAAMGMLRSWYDRDGRTLATREGGGVTTQKIRSTLIVAGEELPGDPATRERCVSIRVARDEVRETVESFNWFQKNSPDFSNITYYWLQDACYADPKVILQGMAEIEKVLKASGCTSRVSKNWAAAGYLGNELAKRFCEGFDFLEYLVKAAVEEQLDQAQEGTVNSFWEAIEVLMADDRSQIDMRCVVREDRNGKNLLHIWYNKLYEEVLRMRGGRESWSKLSLQHAIKEEKYYVSGERRVAFGINQADRKRAMTFDLERAPEALRNIAKMDDE